MKGFIGLPGRLLCIKLLMLLCISEGLPPHPSNIDLSHKNKQFIDFYVYQGNLLTGVYSTHGALALPKLDEIRG